MAQGNRSKQDRAKEIGKAARLFATKTRDAKKIAKQLNTSPRTIQRYARTPEWTAVLQALGYQGDTSFRVAKRRDIQRDNPDLFDKAKAVYLKNAETAMSGWKCAAITAAELNLNPQKIWNWARRFGWWAEKNKNGEVDKNNG